MLIILNQKLRTIYNKFSFLNDTCKIKNVKRLYEKFVKFPSNYNLLKSILLHSFCQNFGLLLYSTHNHKV